LLKTGEIDDKSGLCIARFAVSSRFRRLFPEFMIAGAPRETGAGGVSGWREVIQGKGVKGMKIFSSRT
jgi:hypothetical protein